MPTTDAACVAEARRWYREQGYAPVERDGVTAVVTPAHPDTWEANWLQAGPAADAAAVFAALDRHGLDVVVVDALTPPAVEAALALAGFTAQVTVIELLARGTVASSHPLPTVLTERVGEANWPVFVDLVDRDQHEGKRTGERDEGVSAGLIDGMQRRQETCDYWLLRTHDAAVGYGMTAACPNGLGLIESLFTLPEHRGRGLMSAFITAAAARLRGGGCDGVFLDAHAHDTPKHLYARLGFTPVALTRTWVRSAPTN